MAVSPSIAGRALVAVFLMIGFYLLALAIAGGLLFIPYAEWTVAGRLHIKLALACGLGALVILWSILPRVDKFVPPGPRLLPDKFPRLFQELNSVAAAVRQKMPAEVYLDRDVNAWVAQRGGTMGIGSRRVMGLGLPLMRIITISQMRAVLAHEFGHFYGGDTMLGPWVYKTRSAIMRTVQSLAGERGEGSLLQLPFVWYGKMFLRITHAVSRQQEFSADELAARTVGSTPLISGLSAVHGIAPAFGPFWMNEYVPLLNAGYCAPMLDGFDRFVQAPPIAQAISKHLKKEIDEGKSDPYDTHPPLKERIAAVQKLPAGEERTSDPTALSLIDDVAGLEQELLIAMAGAATVMKLKAIGWETVGMQVYLPQWTDFVKRHASGLAGITPESLPQMATDLNGFGQKFAKILGQSIPGEQSTPLAVSAVGAALAVALQREGWSIEMAPGTSIVLRRGELTIEPFDVMQGLAAKKLTQEIWQQRCAEAGIAGVDLGKVASSPATK